MPCHLLGFWISMAPRIVPFGTFWNPTERHAVSLARVLDLTAGVRCPGVTRGWRLYFGRKHNRVLECGGMSAASQATRQNASQC